MLQILLKFFKERLDSLQALVIYIHINSKLNEIPLGIYKI